MTVDVECHPVSYSLDNCAHCAAVTFLIIRPRSPPLQRVVQMLEDGDIACWNCEDQGAEDRLEVDIYLTDHVGGQSRKRKVWCNHSPKCVDVEV